MPADAITTQIEAAALARLSDQLTTALRAVIESSPFAGLGPVEVARMLGVDKTLASRLMAALRAGDPFVALSSLPGIPPLRQFVRAALKHGADARAVRTAEVELRTFEHELQRTFGTRTRLDAVLTDALPETRRRHQEGARQAVYRGMALIKGVSIDVASVTWVIHPSRESPDQVDILVLAGFAGLRRLRPTARIRLASSHTRARPEHGATLLADLCRPADLSISMTREGICTYYEVSTGSVRRDDAADVFLTEFLPRVSPRAHPAGDDRVFAVGDSVAHPCKRLALSILVHEAVWPGCNFSLRAYDTVMHGVVRLPDPSRDADRLPIDADVVCSPASADALRSFPVQNYAEILRRLTEPRGWDLAGSRMFRCEIVYPLYGAEVLLVRG